MKRELFYRNKRRRFYKNTRLFLPLILFTALVSCGGGGDILAGGGIGGSGNTSVGPITALGSIFVNGIEFQTTNAAVTMNGVSSNEKTLQVGMVVRVDGTVNADGKTGKADTVTFNDNVAGPITSIDYANSTLAVMGQTVIVGTQTIFAGQTGNTPGLAGLAANDMVAVSGMADATGNVMATRIALNTTGSKSQVSGRVSGPTTTTFRINALMVDYSKAKLNQFSSGRIQPGDIVNVTGNLTSSTTLLADMVERMTFYCQDNYSTMFQGFIGTLYYTGQSISGFDIITPFGLHRVELDASTAVSGGTLKVGARVQVEGTVKDNIIQARRVYLMNSMGMMGGNNTTMNPSPSDSWGMGFMNGSN
jgi:hypothetical protein